MGEEEITKIVEIENELENLRSDLNIIKSQVLNELEEDTLIF